MPVEKESRRRLSTSDSDTPKDYNWYTHFGAEKMTNASTYFLPFIPQKYNLDRSTIALNATHPFEDSVTGRKMTFREYDVHGLFGHMQSKVTYE